jgi:hypothetical protein
MSDLLRPVMTGPTESSPTTGRFARLAALFSLFAPFIVFFIYLFLFWYMESHGRTRLATLGVIGSLPLLFILSGLALGIVALAQIKRQEHKGIFGTALAGVCINCLLLVLLFVGPIFLTLAFRKNHPTTPQARLDKANQEMTAPSLLIFLQTPRAPLLPKQFAPPPVCPIKKSFYRASTVG